MLRHKIVNGLATRSEFTNVKVADVPTGNLTALPVVPIPFPLANDVALGIPLPICVTLAGTVLNRRSSRIGDRIFRPCHSHGLLSLLLGFKGFGYVYSKSIIAVVGPASTPNLDS